MVSFNGGFPGEDFIVRVALQIDFTMNATLLQQDMIQSPYWNHGQVMLFTEVAWTDEGYHSCGVISDNLNHDKYTATMFVSNIIDDLQTKAMTLSVSQNFKQKYMFLCIISLLQHNGIQVSWHFFLTNHDNGAVDFFGGTMKRTVFRSVHTSTHHYPFK